MQYTLIIGLEFQYYRRPAKVTISVNNKFIDTFNLHRDYGSVNEPHKAFARKWFQHFDVEKWKTVYAESKWTVPSFFKLYQIDDEHLGGELEIKVKNSNSDYTNGFMKRHSLIKFPVLALFPTVLGKKQGKKLMEILVRLDEALWKKYLLRQPFEKRKQITDLNKHRLPWPCSYFFNVYRKSEIYEKNGVAAHDEWLGGSFTAKLNIRRKHKVFFLDQIGALNRGFTKEHKMPLAVSSFQPLLNIYDENQ